MDKFGFFNLFNTILGEVNKNSANKTEQSVDTNKNEKVKENDSHNDFNKNAILNAIRSHDQFVERVNKNNRGNK